MKTKVKTMVTACAVVGVFSIQGIVNADIMINDRSIADEDWGSLPIGGGWSTQTGTGGSAPSASGGELTMTMVGATGSNTHIKKTRAVPTDYILTSRLKVTQFPDTADFVLTNASAQGNISIADVRGADRFLTVLRPDAIYIADFQSAGVYWEEISLITSADTYYTWQFQVTDVPGAGTGQVDIFRRADDNDPFISVGSSQIQSQDFADQFYIGFIEYNAANTQIQGSMVYDYTYIGIPEPSTISMILMFSGLMLTSRFIRRRRI